MCKSSSQIRAPGASCSGLHRQREDGARGDTEGARCVSGGSRARVSRPTGGGHCDGRRPTRPLLLSCSSDGKTAQRRQRPARPLFLLASATLKAGATPSPSSLGDDDPWEARAAVVTRRPFQATAGGIQRARLGDSSGGRGGARFMLPGAKAPG
jgi:hypothetical protein